MKYTIENKSNACKLYFFLIDIDNKNPLIIVTMPNTPQEMELVKAKMIITEKKEKKIPILIQLYYLVFKS